MSQERNELCYIFNKDNKFYVSRDSNYTIKAKVLPRLNLIRKRKETGAEFSFGREKLKNWRFNSSNVTYNHLVFKDGMLFICVYFDGDGKEDEYVQMKLKDAKINLEDYPFFDINCKVENSGIQIIEAVLGLDFNRDGVPDGHIKGIYQMPAPKEFSNFRYNAYTKAKRMFPDKLYYEVVELELFPHKLWRKNCSLHHRKGEYKFWIKDLSFYDVFPEKFILDDKGVYTRPAEFEFSKAIAEIDEEKYRFYKKFKNKEDAKENIYFEQTVHLKKGEHHLKILKDDSFKVEWVVVEPVSKMQNAKCKMQNAKPEITFRKINSTKYEVKVKGVKKTFWLVFSESFHKDWKLYFHRKPETGNRKPEKIVMEYPKLGVKEEKHTMKFTPGDIKYLGKVPLGAEHHLVNGYANGWYIDPEKLDLPENFSLVLYFAPQSLFYLSLMISVAALLGCAIYLGYSVLRKKNQGFSCQK